MEFKKVIFFLLCSVTNVSNGQNTITGRITNQDNLPLSFANVILYQDKTETAVFAVATEEDGAYLLKKK